MSEEHTHSWVGTLHMDSCHKHETHYSCKCGAGMSVYAERDFKKDPWSSVWALPDCDRCKELMNGARRKATVRVITLPDGSVIKNNRLLKARWK